MQYWLCIASSWAGKGCGAFVGTGQGRGLYPGAEAARAGAEQGTLLEATAAEPLMSGAWARHGKKMAGLLFLNLEDWDFPAPLIKACSETWAKQKNGFKEHNQTTRGARQRFHKAECLAAASDSRASSAFYDL
jgi:hypothetical protein